MKDIKYRQARWHTPLIPALGRQRQADFWVRGQPCLQSEFQDSQDYTEKPCLKKPTNQPNQTKPNQTKPKQNKTKQNKTKQKTDMHSNTIPAKANRWITKIALVSPKSQLQETK
jgi:hypothetical protein